MLRIGIVSDDLTGTSTAAAHVAEQVGQRASTWLQRESPLGMDPNHIAAVNTSSRKMSADEASTAVYRAALLLASMGYDPVIKRFDSHLRGHLGAEIEAYVSALGYSTVFMTGAYPAIGKATVNGMQFMSGTPVHEGPMRHDPVHPVQSSNLVEILQHSTSLSVGLLSLTWSGKPAEYLIGELLQRRCYDVIVCDATSHLHLRQIAEAAVSAGLFDAGSRSGIASTDMAFPLHCLRAQLERDHGTGKPLLCIAGSATSRARDQVQHLLSNSSVRCITLNPGAEKAAFNLAKHSLVEGYDVLMDTGPLPSFSEDRGFDFSAALAGIASELIVEDRVSGLLVVGGDSADEICEALGISEIHDPNVWDVAVTAGFIDVGVNAKLPVVMRSGAVGDMDQLERLFFRLKTLTCFRSRWQQVAEEGEWRGG